MNQDSYIALKRSEMEFRALSEQAAVGVTKAETATGRYVFVNQRFADIVGYTRDELLTMSFHALTEPDDLAEDLDNLGRLLKGDLHEYAMEKRYRRKDGTAIWVNLTVSPLWLEGESPRYVIGVVEDITERKHAQDALQKSEESLRGWFETMAEGAVLIAADGQIISANRAAESILGLTRSEIKGRVYDAPQWKMLRPDGTPMPAEEMAGPRAMKEKRAVKDVVMGTVKPNGSVSWISVNAGPLIDANGELQGVVGTFTDITERKRAEEALQESEAKFRSMFENMAAASCLDEIIYEDGKAVDYRIIDINPAFEKIIGVAKKDTVGKRASTLYGGGEIPFLNAYIQVAETGKPVSFEAYFPPIKRYLHITASCPGKGRFSTVFSDITERKQADQALQNSEKRLREAQEMAHLGFWDWDVKTGAVIWSDEVFKIFGLDPKEFTPHIDSILALSPWPEDHNRDLELIDRAVKTHNPGSYEQRFLRPDNSIGHYYSTFQGTYDEHGELLSIVGTVLDTTERKKAEEALGESEAKFRTMVETIPLAIYLSVGVEQVCEYINPKMVELFGYARDEIPSVDKWWPLAYPDEAYRRQISEEWTRRVQRAIDTQSPIEPMEVVVTCKDGSKKNILWAYITVGDKNYSCGLDLTERKKAEEALKESEERYHAMMDQAGDAVFVHDETGRVQDVNRKACESLGYSREELLSKSILDIDPDATPTEKPKLWGKVLAGEQFTFESRQMRKDGSILPVEVTLGSVRLPLGQAVLGLVRDITDRKRAEEEKAKLQTQLYQSQKVAAIGQLAGGVAHDFNNLLTGILGNIALMRSSLPPADPLLENLNAAETAAHRAADLTKGLLTFSRSAVVLAAPMNVTAALDASLALLKQSLPATMEIVHDYGQTVWNVLLDQSQITQILLNLAVNARDAMNGKGTLTVKARNEVVGQEYVRNHLGTRTGEFVHLSVSDTGSGMSSDVLQHVFEPFYTTKPIGSGTGLGLSIVYGAVKQAGGWVTVDSKIDAGATFDIYLPRCLQEPTESVAPSPLPDEACAGTILVVEDEPVVSAVAQTLLSRSGYTVLSAPDGASALNVLRDHPVDIGLILLDMTMPGMTTNEIIRAIRTLDPTVPILLNSGYTSNDSVKHMLEEGSVQGFLGKPYDLDQLLGMVQELLRRT